MTYREARFVLLFLLLALVCSVIAPRPQFLFSRMRSFAYLSASILTGFCLYFELRRWPKSLLARWAGVGAMILLVGALLEVLLEPVRAVSDVYRYLNFRFPYDADLRDIYYHHGIRPKFFSSEPSYLSKNFAFLLICWLYSSKQRHRLMLFTLVSAAGFGIMRSPVLFIMPIAVFIHLFFNPESRVSDRFKISRRVLIVGIASIFTTVFFGWIAWDSIGPRISLYAIGGDTSASVRLKISFAVVPKLLVFNPLTGIGVGGTEAFAYDVISESYAGVWKGIIQQKSNQGMLEHLVQNCPANFISSFGLLGSAAGIFMLLRMQRTFASERGILFWPVFLAFSLTEGALNGFRIWTMFFVLLAYLCGKESKPG